MAATWTTLTTHTTGELVTASAYNALFGPTGNLAFLYAGQGAHGSNIGTAHSIATGTATKTTIGTVEHWDPLGWLDAAAHRFQPNVAGSYMAVANTYGSTLTNQATLSVYKNGAFFAGSYTVPSAGNDWAWSLSTPVAMNGSSDYLEIYIQHGSGSSKDFITSAAFWRIGS